MASERTSKILKDKRAAVVAPAGRPISIVILALGGEGGGVLADWLVDLAEPNGYYAQTTSIPGVAQRTGATLYYIELFPEAPARAAGKEPILALMPMPGEVDLVVASELMEAGRAVERGLITPDRTTVIASTHRVYAMTEKIAMGDGRAEASAFVAACRQAAQRVVLADMQRLAEQHGSAISASLFGAIAGSSMLPFKREQFEDAIRRRGIGVAASLAAFAAGFSAVAGDGAGPLPPETSTPLQPTADSIRKADTTVMHDIPAPVRDVILEGMRRLIDYQDRRYADEYLVSIGRIRELDQKHGDGTWRLLSETARHLALWMSFEDTIRVADLKIRSSRFERVRDEVKMASGQLLRIREFMHPRVQEIAESVPAAVGRPLLNNRVLRAMLGRLTAKGRVIETTSLRGFLLLYAVAALRPLRRRSLRYQAELARIEGWLREIEQIAPTHYGLATEIAVCPRLIKGYGDTHERGTKSFERIMAAAARLQQRDDGAAVMARLREAALADERGEELNRAFSDCGLGAF